MPLDGEKAVSLFRKAAAKGHTDSQTRLGVMYSNGEAPLAKDDKKAVGTQVQERGRGVSDVIR